MRKYFIQIFIQISIVLFLLNLIGCKNNKDNEIKHPQLTGYFYIYHIGEEDKPISYFIVKTSRDTTYRQVTKQWENMNELSIEFNMMELRDKNIEDCSISVFSQFKDILYEYNKNNKVEPNYNYGTFKIDLVDNIDTLTFTLYSSEYAKSFFENLEKIAKENLLEKASNRFSFYKNMQPNQ